ncbi:hypothetical protein TWF718_006189 [Orbilia javanica]|uniref:Uncharacterized protein n=1 Tax=Orbilia javanica TaxID=47235 RepID=A0AAN8MQW1_9PEZI
MDLYPIIDSIRHIIVRLFITLGLICILPIFILFLLEPLVYILRFIEDYLPSSISQKKPVRQPSMSISNLSSITSETNSGFTNGDGDDLKKVGEALGEALGEDGSKEGEVVAG